MGTWVLLSALVAEVGFAVYCIATKSNHEHLRNLVRIGALALFVILTVVSVFAWSFRWFGLALLVVVLAAIGGWKVIGRREERKAYSAGRTVLRAIAMFVLVFVALIPELVFPQHRPPKTTGTYQVATVSFTYTDPQRIETFARTGEYRKVNVEFWYPRDGRGIYPLVVFSHGAFGMKTSNTSTFQELAGNGYVVCSIDHPYHALFTIGTDHRLVRVDPSFYREIVDTNAGKYDETTVFKLEQKWMKLRTDDINFVLNTIIARSESGNAEPVYRLVDRSRIGLMGHSLGGASSALVARQRNDIAAVVSLDADMQGEYLEHSGGDYTLNPAVYPVPILTILADDVVRIIKTIPNARSVVAVEHVAATTPTAHIVHIKGTDHMSVTDLPIVSPLLSAMLTSSVKKAGGGESADKTLVIEEMNGLVLEFFNAYLKGEGTFAAPEEL